jgi:DNA-binding transcriptional LysR family regulator
MRLESDLGQKLFSRSSQGIQMTTFGDNLFKSLKQTIQYWNEISSKEIRKKLVIGVNPSIANSYFPQLFSELLKKYSDLLLTSDFSSSLDITCKVAEHYVDVGLVINPVKNVNLVAQTISTSWLSLCLNLHRDPGKSEPIRSFLFLICLNRAEIHRTKNNLNQNYFPIVAMT